MMAQSRVGVRWTSVLSILFFVVGVATVVGQRPAHAAVIDGPPIIGQDPPVPQAQNPAGGGAVRIYGKGLLGVTAVTIGGVSLAATDFKVVDGNLIIAQVPAAGAGILNAANDGFAHITVTDGEGTGTTDLDGDGVVDDQKCTSCVGGELGAIFYTDATLTLGTSTNLHAGQTVTMTLAGHRPGNQGGWALTELNPLVNFLEQAPPDPDNFPPGPAYGEVLAALTPDANGAGSATVTVQSTSGSPQFNGKDQDYDANGDCPVAQITADYGLDKCILGYSEFGMASIERLISFGTPDVNPIPAAPTLNLTLTSAGDGSSVSVSGKNWNAAPHFGSDTAMDDPGESAVLIDVCNVALTSCTAASSPAASVDPVRYFDSGTDPDIQPVTGVYSGATLSGSFTVAGSSGCAPNCVVRVSQQRYDIEANAPVASTYITATTALSTSIATNLAVNDVSVTEGNSGTTTANFTVTRSGNVAGASSVSYATTNGTAISGSDYTAIASTTLNFAAGETSKTVPVTVSGDTLFEPDETFTLDLSSPSGATIVRGSGTGTIRNDDGPSYLSVGDVTVAEGNSGTTATTFNVIRDGNAAGTSTVTYATANGTATSGSDYTAIGATTLTFAPGETSKAVTVNVTGDTVNEGNEAFTLTLSGASSGTTIADSSATATIVNDDAAPTLTVNDIFVTEGNAGTTTATFTVYRWGAIGGASTVKYATSNGTATAGSDYTGVALTTLSFAAGDTSKTVTVNVTGDTTSEPHETFSLTLSAPTGAALADTLAIATILDDDTVPPRAAPLPAISINDVSLVEGNVGTTTANFTVTRSGNTNGTSSVSYATANGTATSTNGDYTAIAATTLNFAAGETSKTVSVSVGADTYYESAVSETFFLNLSSATGATISDTQGTATIFNDDFVYISIGDVAVHEGNTGTTTADFIIRRSGSVGSATTLTYVTANGTATAGSDYTAKSSTSISFSGDETSKLVSVTITGDTTPEPDETFLVNLSGATTGHIISDTAATGTIVNDD